MKPITPRQRVAAQMVGEGKTKKAAAAEVGVSSRTLSDWSRRPDFRELVQKARDRQLDREPTAAEVLRSALTATTPKGDPDWKARIAAARILVVDKGGAEAEVAGPRELVVNESALEDR